MDRVNAVVVTFNRKVLLQECIDALLNQSYKLNKIIIVDNASTDGTHELLKEKYNIPEVKVYTLNKNTGGAGGFYYGTKKAFENADWIWEMDDDTIPSSTALENLIKAKNGIDGNISFLASTVYGIDGKPMNVPTIDARRAEGDYATWYTKLKDGIVAIEKATLVSLLFNAEAVKKIGAPHPFFFLWGDDSEYTLRMTHCYGKAYLVGNSVVIHKRVSGNFLSIVREENVKRIEMYKLLFRNMLVYTKYYYSKWKLLTAWGSCISQLFKSIFKAKNHRFLRFKTVLKGMFDYLFGRYNKKAFENRFNNIYENYLDEYLIEEK